MDTGSGKDEEGGGERADSEETEVVLDLFQNLVGRLKLNFQAQRDVFQFEHVHVIQQLRQFEKRYQSPQQPISVVGLLDCVFQGHKHRRLQNHY